MVWGRMKQKKKRRGRKTKEYHEDKDKEESKVKWKEQGRVDISIKKEIIKKRNKRQQ